MATPPFKVKAVFEYSSPHEDDLHFPTGQIITVTDLEDDDWYAGEYVDASGTKQEGIFPKNFVEKYEPTAPPRPVRTARPKKEADAPAPAPASALAEPSADTIAKSIRDEPAVDAVEDEPSTVTSKPPQAPAALPLTEEPVPAPASTPVSTQPAKAAGPKVSSPPPPAAEKPSGGSFKDRIAAFNKAAPPPVPFKPGAPGVASSSFIKKPFVAPPPSKNAYVAPPREQAAPKAYRREEDPEIAAQESENKELAERAGLLSPSQAGDEEEQPKPTSLKERIALLQKQQMEQAARHADAAQKKDKPKRPPKKRSESQHPEDTAAEGNESVLERQDSHETGAKRSMEISRDDMAVPKDPSGRKPSKAPPAVPGLVPHESFIDANDADMSGAGDDTEEHEDTSTGRDDSDNVSRKQASAAPTLPLRAPAAPREEPDVGEEDGAASAEEGEEGELEEEEEDDVDPEVRRKEEIRARMAKMSGGMGMYGVFGPPGGMPMPGAIPPKKKATGTNEKSKRSETEAAQPLPGAAPPLPGMALPGLARKLSRAESPQEVEVEDAAEPEPASITRGQPAAEVTDVEDIKADLPVRTASQRTAAPPVPPHTSAPPVPSGRPLPPPIPTETRPLPPPPPPPAAVASPTEGSESDDENSLNAQGEPMKTPTPATFNRLSGAPAVPSRPSHDSSSHPQSPPRKDLSYFSTEATPMSPETPGSSSKRTSHVPPIPGSGAIPVQPQARAPPPPPPGPGQVSAEDSDEEVTEYEGDYDTDIAPTAPYKEALGSHTKHESLAESEVPHDSVLSSPRSPPPIPPAAPPRAVPPPPPSHAHTEPRRSVDMPGRAAPPPPPAPISPPYEDGDDEYDPYRYSGANQGMPTERPPTLPTRNEEEDLYSTSPPQQRAPVVQERSAPPPPPRDLAPPISSRPTQRQSLDVQRTQSATRKSTDLGRMSMDSGFVANDVDLAQGSLWWAQPNGVPPVFQGRRDILHETEESTTSKRGGKVIVTKDLYVLFQDYSQTVISARYDAQNPADATLEQRHEQAPPRPRQDQLEDAHEKFGRRIAEAVAAKKDSVVADGTPFGLVTDLLQPFQDALLPVGTRAYGALVYFNMANASVSQIDEIRPGDIITLRNAKLQGKHGAMHAKYSIEVGAGTGHVGVVAEWDGTKKKVRAWEQGRENKKVRLESYKLDDLRSGEVKIWRVMPRSWVGWEGSN